MNKNINNEIFTPNDGDVDLVSLKAMKDKLDLIKSQIPTFIKNFSAVSKSKVEVSNIDIDRIIKKSVDESDLNEEDTELINGFYETWMSVFMMVGSDKEALEIVFKMIHSQ